MNEREKPQLLLADPEEAMLHEPDLSALPAKSAMKKNPNISPSTISSGPKVTPLSSSPVPVIVLDTYPSTGSNKEGDSTDDFICPKKKHLTWDENAIEEHDLTRGTRMKIEEPNTPYAHYDQQGHSDDDSSQNNPKTPPAESQKFTQNLAIHWDHLETKLGAVAAARDAYPSSPSACSSGHSDGEEEKKKKELRKLEFKSHRKNHYDEIGAWKKWKVDHPGDGTDGDDDMDIRS